MKNSLTTYWLNDAWIHDFHHPHNNKIQISIHASPKEFQRMEEAGYGVYGQHEGAEWLDIPIRKIRNVVIFKKELKKVV
jgi:hypothetical protein